MLPTQGATPRPRTVPRNDPTTGPTVSRDPQRFTCVCVVSIFILVRLLFPVLLGDELKADNSEKKQVSAGRPRRVSQTQIHFGTGEGFTRKHMYAYLSWRPTHSRDLKTLQTFREMKALSENGRIDSSWLQVNSAVKSEMYGSEGIFHVQRLFCANVHVRTSMCRKAAEKWFLSQGLKAKSCSRLRTNERPHTTLLYAESMGIAPKRSVCIPVFVNGGKVVFGSSVRKVSCLVKQRSNERMDPVGLARRQIMPLPHRSGQFLINEPRDEFSIKSSLLSRKQTDAVFNQRFLNLPADAPAANKTWTVDV